MMLSPSHRAVRAIAAAALLGSTVLVAAGPVAARQAQRATAHPKGAWPDDVETRIKTLHKELHITPAQEAAWNNVAQVMRENAQAMKDVRAKTEREKTANAVEQVNAYAAMIDAHADGVHKFLPAFQTLYDGMTDAQKKTADVVFRSRVEAAKRRHMQ